MNVGEELLELQSLKNQTRTTYLFASVYSAVDGMKLPWNKVNGITTDGTPAMTGERSGLSTLLCNKVSEEGGKAIKQHYIILQQVLCVKHLKYDHVIKPVIKTINYICSKAVGHRQFKQFLLDIRAEYRDVVYHNMGTSPSKDFHISTELESSAKIDSCGKDQNHIRKRSSSLSKINDKKSPTKYSTTNKSREYLVKGNESRNRHTVQSEASKEDSNNIKKVSSPGKNKMFLPKYLIQRKKEIEEERTRQQSKIADQNVPFGQKLVSEAEKQEMLSLLQIKYNLLCKELRELSITNDTLRIKQKHKELEDKIVDVEKGINIFSRKTVYIKNE